MLVDHVLSCFVKTCTTPISRMTFLNRFVIFSHAFRFSVPALVMGMITWLNLGFVTGSHDPSFSCSHLNGFTNYSPGFYLPASAEPILPPGITSLNIPLKRAGRLLLVEARIDGLEGNLIFDTGATGLVLNRTYFSGYKVIESVQSHGITGTLSNVERVMAERIEISGLEYHSVIGDMANLGHIENRRGVKVLGLLGLDMIKKLETVIDLPNNQLQVYAVDSKGNRTYAESDHSKPDLIQKFEPVNNIMVIRGSIGGNPMYFCFDTGAETNAISSNVSKKVLSKITVTRRMNLRGAGQSQWEVLFGTLDDFGMGSIKLNGMETIITNLDALGEAYGTQIDGMLGFNFLEKGKVVLNFQKKQMSMYLAKTENG